MDILFQQSAEGCADSAFSDLGFEKCSIRWVVVKRDRSQISLKKHNHTEYEIHVVTKGKHEYLIDGKTVSLNAGELLIISSRCAHTQTYSLPNTEKYACFFNISSTGNELYFKSSKTPYIHCQTPAALSSLLSSISAEHKKNEPLSREMISSLSLSALIILARLAGIQSSRPQQNGLMHDPRYILAKQYVADNVQRQISVSELADYCHVSTKQLSRIFAAEEGISISEHIRSTRCEYIKNILVTSDEPIGKISEELDFSSEYYFNSYFKRNVGMTPGAYRKKFSES